jgi:hypothetical protein
VRCHGYLNLFLYCLSELNVLKILAPQKNYRHLLEKIELLCFTMKDHDFPQHNVEANNFVRI